MAKLLELGDYILQDTGSLIAAYSKEMAVFGPDGKVLASLGHRTVAGEAYFPEEWVTTVVNYWTYGFHREPGDVPQEPQEGTSYEDYLASVQSQQQRDRDRFIGVDSHDDEERYDARTGIAYR